MNKGLFGTRLDLTFIFALEVNGGSSNVQFL